MACHIILWGPRQRASAPGRSQKNKNQSLWCVNRRIKQRFCCLAWNLWITRNMKLFNTIISNSQVWPADCVRSGRFRKVAGKVQVRSRRDHTVFAETWSEMCWGISWIYAIYCIFLSFDCCHIIPGSWIPLGRWTREFERSGARENEKNDRHGQGHTYTYFELQCVCNKTKSAGGTSVSRTTICASVSSNKWTSRWSCASVPEPAAISRLTTERNNTVMQHLLYCSIIGHDDPTC